MRLPPLPPCPVRVLRLHRKQDPFFYDVLGRAPPPSHVSFSSPFFTDHFPKLDARIMIRVFSFLRVFLGELFYPLLPPSSSFVTSVGDPPSSLLPHLRLIYDAKARRAFRAPSPPPYPPLFHHMGRPPYPGNFFQPSFRYSASCLLQQASDFFPFLTRSCPGESPHRNFKSRFTYP